MQDGGLRLPQYRPGEGLTPASLHIQVNKPFVTSSVRLCFLSIRRCYLATAGSVVSLEDGITLQWQLSRPANQNKLQCRNEPVRAFRVIYELLTDPYVCSHWLEPVAQVSLQSIEQLVKQKPKANPFISSTVVSCKTLM